MKGTGGESGPSVEAVLEPGCSSAGTWSASGGDGVDCACGGYMPSRPPSVGDMSGASVADMGAG